jgi:hypothetical protein
MSAGERTKRYEERDVALRPIVVAAGALAVLIVLSGGLMYGLERGLAAREAERSAPENPLAATYGRKEPPAPRLQANPSRDLATLRAREEELLDTYGWIDRATGRVRIPVERAIELMAEDARR